MNHRSNMDYVLVAFLAAERTALSYAVGEWARIWPLQQLIRSMGAYFVRRNSNNPIYRRVLERYVHMATEAGVAQAMYPEGGLSRDGRLREPKLGLFDYMLKSFDPKGANDIVFVPVALNYDRVLEDRTLLRSLDGAPRRSAWFAARTALGFWFSQIGLMLRGRWYPLRLRLRQFRRPDLGARLAGRACRRVGGDLRGLDKDQRFEIVGRLAQRRDGRDRPPGAGAAGVADRHRPARGRRAARRAGAQGARLRPDGASREPRRQALSCRAAIATMPSMSACACWRCATWSTRAPRDCSRRWQPSGRCSRITPTPSPICADLHDHDHHALAHRLLRRHRLLHQPAVDVGRGDGLLHDVRDRPDHDLQHRHRRAVRRQADGAGGDLRRAGHRRGARPAHRASAASPRRISSAAAGSRRSSAPPSCSIPARASSSSWTTASTRSGAAARRSYVHPVLASLKSRLLALALMVVLGVLLIVVILASVLISAYAGVLEKLSRSSANGSARRCRRSCTTAFSRPSSP